MFVGCPIFVRQGRGVLNTPHKRPDRGGFMFVGCPIFGRQGRGVLNTPHKTTQRGDLIYLWVGVFIPAGYMWGVCNTPLPYRQEIFLSCLPSIFPGIHPFLVLIQEKDAKRKSRHQGCRPIWPGTDPLVFSFPFFDLPSPYDSNRRYDCESRCDRATFYV